MKLFGVELFKFKKEATELLYDFAQHGILGPQYFGMNEATMVGPLQYDGQKRMKPDATLLSPKKLFKLGALNKHKFSIKVDDKYLEEQIAQIKEKLNLLGKRKKIKFNTRDLQMGNPMPMNESGDVMFGRMELESILERLENRKRINMFKNILGKYPHTTSELVQSIIENNSHLACRPVGGFVPDMPKDAVNAMKEYTNMCVELCNKKPVFYIIAKHEDFQRKNARRDPILLAQSPFGFFWQILGAWDDEMIYLGDL